MAGPYAVISDRGKQYLVRAGERLRVDLRTEPKGQKVTFDRVLLVSDEAGIKTGQPTVAGIAVEATVVGEHKAKKVIVFKKRRRKGLRRKNGHRQRYTDLVVDRIG
jgi:large subunit ribosomal protein L21